MKTVFFGSSNLVISIIEQLNTHFDLAFVVTTEKNSTNAVPEYCIAHKIPYISTQTLTNEDIQSQLRDSNSQLAVVASFGLIIPEEVINIFPKGIVNIHPSFLPQYRGATPVQEALKNGDIETAVSIMIIDKEMDHGPLLAQVPLEISPEDTAETIYKKAFVIGAEKLVDILPAYVAGNITPREQDHTKATYTPKNLTREDGFVDINNLPNNLSNLIRAYHPWPGVWTKVQINNQEKILKLLPNNMFQMEGKKPVSKKDLLNGYPELKEVIEKLS